MYKIEVKPLNFEDDMICLGWQLADILSNFEDLVDIKWAGFDIFGSTHTGLSELFKPDYDGNIVFDSTKKLIFSVKEVVQFERGVFCLLESSEKIEFEDGVPETEMPEGMQLKKSLLEIRTFDYSYFEIYSPKREYLDKIRMNLLNSKGVGYKEV